MMKRRMSKPKAAVVLVLCLMSMAVLGWLTWQEMNDREAGATYYARLTEQMNAMLAAEQTAENADSQLMAKEPSDEKKPKMQQLKTDSKSLLPLWLFDKVKDDTWIMPSAIDFQTLWQTCPDVTGWIRIDGMNINYPVVHGTDNFFYLSHLPDKTPNKGGSIMMDASNAPDFTDDVTILHGHHMRSGEMFGDLSQYKDPVFWQAHQTMKLYTPEGDYEVEIIAACTVDGQTFGYEASFADDASYRAFVRRIRDASYFYAQSEVKPGDRLILMSTCAYQFQNARFVVLGKIIEE